MASLLFVLAHSTDAPNRAATALETAAAAADTGHTVALWLTDEGVRLGIQGVDEALARPAGAQPSESLEVLRLRGAVLYCSRPCFERRQFETTALRPDAELAEPEDLARLVAEERFVPVAT